MDKTNEREKEKKRLVERLASHNKIRNKSGGSRHKIMFLAKKDEIREALAAGWTRRSIWEELKNTGEFLGSYDVFVRSCREFLKEGTDKKYPTVNKQTAPEAISSQATQNVTTATTGFKFTPATDEKSLY